VSGVHVGGGLLRWVLLGMMAPTRPPALPPPPPFADQPLFLPQGVAHSAVPECKWYPLRVAAYWLAAEGGSPVGAPPQAQAVASGFDPAQPAKSEPGSRANVYPCHGVPPILVPQLELAAHPNWYSPTVDAAGESAALAASFAGVKVVVVGDALKTCTKLRLYLEVGRRFAHGCTGTGRTGRA
jgi:hypothetical protein